MKRFGEYSLTIVISHYLSVCLVQVTESVSISFLYSFHAFSARTWENSLFLLKLNWQALSLMEFLWIICEFVCIDAYTAVLLYDLGMIYSNFMWCICAFSNSLYMLVRMGNHVINAEDTGSFLSKTFGTCLVQIKRNFDKFIVSVFHLHLLVVCFPFLWNQFSVQA